MSLVNPNRNQAQQSCSSCCKPCIIINNRCQIAKVRIALNCSFKQAYELIVQCEQESLAGDFPDRECCIEFKTEGSKYL